jgi:hypothetical protein
MPPNAPHRGGCPWRARALPPASICGRALQMTPSTATPSVICGLPPTMCSRLKPIMVVGSKLGRRRRWNAGTPPCESVWAATFGKRCPFPNLMSIMTWVPSGFVCVKARAFRSSAYHFSLLLPGSLGEQCPELGRSRRQEEQRTKEERVRSRAADVLHLRPMMAYSPCHLGGGTAEARRLKQCLTSTRKSQGDWSMTCKRLVTVEYYVPEASQPGRLRLRLIA